MNIQEEIRFPLISPEAVSIVTTYKCSAECRGCCFGCSPKRSERISLEKMKAFVAEAINSFPSIKLGILTGGECFTIGEDLYAMVEYMHALGLRTRVVTNGYWASSESRAANILNRLKNCGLDEINYSTGDYHQAWVLMDYVINGIVSAIQLDICVAVNFESHGGKELMNVYKFKESTRLQKYLQSPLLTIISGIWIEPDSSIEAGNHLTQIAHTKRCKQLFRYITISPNCEVLCCCGLTIERHNYLNLGIYKEGTLQTIWFTQFLDFIKLWLFTEGPSQIIDFVKKKGYNLKIYEDGHMCEKCNMIFSDSDVCKILKASYKEVMYNVFSKYYLYAKSKSKIQSYENKKNSSE